MLHDLFMLTTLPFSSCILIGMTCRKCVIKSLFHSYLSFLLIDLADRFLPKLQSLNCELSTWFHQIMSLPYCLSDQIFQNPVNDAN